MSKKITRKSDVDPSILRGPLEDRFLSLHEVIAFTQRSRSSLMRDVEAGRFPPPVELGPRQKGWRRSVVLKWAADRRVARTLQ